MNKNRLFLSLLTAAILLLNAAFLAGCSFVNDVKEEVTDAQSDDLAASVDKNLVDANTNFGFNIFKKLINEDSEKNVFISPLSVLLALAMTYNGALGDTSLEMADALEFEGFDLEELNSGFSDLMAAVKNADSEIDRAIANSIWYGMGYDIKKDFIERNEKYYDSEINEIDFSGARAVDTINGWIEEETRGKIDRMISAIPEGAVMYLINAIYFKGRWTYPFDEEQTVDDDFYLDGGTAKKVPMMSLKEKFDYYKGDNFSALRLPYGEEKMSMYTILPDKGVDVDGVVESMDEEKWNSLKSSLRSSEVSLKMPRYKIEYGIKLLNDTLTELGMGIAFDPDRADFSGIISNESAHIWISRVLHKAFIEVNEKGSEAAAATVVEMVESAVPDGGIIEFTVDRPFFFIIADDRSGSILFMGRVIEP
ncbi:MAG: serpin family protein [Actinomycetota bacterium]|nr:serpin family protein [Actinomycetota bacterium]